MKTNVRAAGKPNHLAMKVLVVFLLTTCLFGMNVRAYKKHVYVPKSMTWTGAREYCRKQHDDLSITSNAELVQLSLNPSITIAFYWIGLNRSSSTPLVWKWVNEVEATDVLWEAGQPDTLHELCASIKQSNNRAYDTACFLSLPFYCMEEYELVLVQEDSTWDEALAYCKENYMNLAELTSDLIMEEAKSKSELAVTNGVWMGLRFIAGEWFWLTGNNDDGEYKSWSVEGDLLCPPLNQRCGVYNGTENVWKPADCTLRLSFLCVHRRKGDAYF